MKPLLEKTIESRIRKYILSNKYLREDKYYKNNYWSWAHFESWAATGQCGGCKTCNKNYYNATLHNKRAATLKGGQKAFVKEVSSNFCDSCVSKIHEILKVDIFRIHKCP